VYDVEQAYQAPMVNYETKMINTVPSPLYLPDQVETFSSFSMKVRKGAMMVLKHIEEVWCGSQKDSYEYVVRWFAGVIVGGRKMKTALNLLTQEGAGKGIILEFIANKVIGSDLAIMMDKQESITGNFNKILMGKVLVNVNEFSTETRAQWK